MINCEFENGNKATLRHACANMIILNAAKDSVLLVRRAPHLLEGGKWCIPGGYMEMNQRVIDAARAEALQETGYEVEPFGFVCISDGPERGDNGRQNVVFNFVGIAGKQAGTPDDESSEQAWFKLDALPPREEWAFDHGRTVAHYLANGVIPVDSTKLFLR